MAKETKLAVEKTMEGLQLAGATLAQSFIDAEQSSNESKRNLLLAGARAHADSADRTKAMLEGYANKFVELGYSDSIVRTRKSEFNAVFKALAKTEVTEHNYKVLSKVEGTYHDFISMARELVKGETKGDEVKTSNRKPKVTEKQEAMINEKIKSADIIQISDFMQSGAEALNVPRPIKDLPIAQRQQFLLIAQIASNMIHNAQYDEAVKEFARAILVIADEGNAAIGKTEVEGNKEQSQAIAA